MLWTIEYLSGDGSWQPVDSFSVPSERTALSKLTEGAAADPDTRYRMTGEVDDKCASKTAPRWHVHFGFVDPEDPKEDSTGGLV